MLFAATLFSLTLLGQPSFADIASSLADQILELAPPVDATVQSISPEGIVIDAGILDRVVQGMQFEVYHPGQTAAGTGDPGKLQFTAPIGEIVVARVSEESSLTEAQGLLLGIRKGDIAVSKPRWCGLRLELNGAVAGEKVELIRRSLSGRLYTLGLMGSPEALGYRPHACGRILQLSGETAIDAEGTKATLAVRSGEYHLGDIAVDFGALGAAPAPPTGIDTIAMCVSSLEEGIVSAAVFDHDRLLCIARDRILVLGKEDGRLGVELASQMPSPTFACQRDPAAIIIPVEDGPMGTFLLSSDEGKYGFALASDGEDSLAISRRATHAKIRSVPGRNYFELLSSDGQLHEILNMATGIFLPGRGSQLAVITRGGKLELIGRGGVEHTMGHFGYAFSTGDVDGDGADEIITTSNALPGESDRIRVLKRTGGGWMGLWESPIVDSSISAVTAVDLNSDDFEDIVVFIDRGNYTQLVAFSGKELMR